MITLDDLTWTEAKKIRRITGQLTKGGEVALLFDSDGTWSMYWSMNARAFARACGHMRKHPEDLVGIYSKREGTSIEDIVQSILSDLLYIGAVELRERQVQA